MKTKRVVKSMGVRLTGKTISNFPWKESTDGTYRAPDKGYIAVAWDDGTKGYIHKHHLEDERNKT